MIAAVVNSQNCWLLHHGPAEGATRLEVSLAVRALRSLTGRTVRRPSAFLPTYAIAWSALIDATEYAAMLAASRTAQDEPVLAPVWSLSWRPATETPTLEGGLIVAYTEDWSDWEINPVSYDGYDFAAPLIYGRFRQPVRLQSISGDLKRVEIQVEEDAVADYALAPVDGILAADTMSGGFPVFPFLPDWSDTPPEPGLGVTDVERNDIGSGRIKASIFYPQTPEQVFSATFTGLERADTARFIAWWIRREGIAGAHKVPLADFGVIEGSTVTARHTNQTLTLQCSGYIATTELAWREVAAEATVPAGETVGTTLGRLPPGAWFFKIDLDYNGAIRTWRLTSWESGATAGGHEWTYNACDFDRLTQDMDLEDDVCTCHFRWFTGGPWDNWLPGQLSARGILTLYRADANADGSFAGFTQRWSGDLAQPQLDGPIVTWRAHGANALFSRSAPSQVMSKVCGTRLFKLRCGLDIADWIFNAEIAAVAGNVVTITDITRANAEGLPDGFGAEDWFGLGWIEWTSGGAKLREGIAANAAVSGGDIELTLDRAIGLAPGALVSVVPGCDRLRASGCSKFANTDNFRGFDLMPAVSPSFILPQRNSAAAKK